MARWNAGEEIGDSAAPVRVFTKICIVDAQKSRLQERAKSVHRVGPQVLETSEGVRRVSEKTGVRAPP